MRQALEDGRRPGIAKTSGLCRGLLKREAAMWNWTTVPGLEPTNNLAERMLRPAVIWRKKSFGSDSRGGSVFVEPHAQRHPDGEAASRTCWITSRRRWSLIAPDSRFQRRTVNCRQMTEN